jgi:hypothetical protein
VECGIEKTWWGVFFIGHFHPETGEPLADIWDVCLYISKRFQERFSNHPEINVSGKLIQ